jgi:hypothetical protein
MANPQQTIQQCIESCSECLVACEVCAETCAALEGMQGTIRLCRDCIGVCSTTISFLARGSQLSKELCQVTATACQRCYEETQSCGIDECQACARACLATVEACTMMAASAYLA